MEIAIEDISDANYTNHEYICMLKYHSSVPGHFLSGTQGLSALQLVMSFVDHWKRES